MLNCTQSLREYKYDSFCYWESPLNDRFLPGLVITMGAAELLVICKLIKVMDTIHYYGIVYVCVGGVHMEPHIMYKIDMLSVHSHSQYFIHMTCTKYLKTKHQNN